MKKSFILIFLLSSCHSAFSWGQKGHDTVAFIAQNHLTPTTKSAVDSLLNGYSMTYWSNWLDTASHTDDFSYTKTWHYKNIDEDQTYQSAPNIPEGNIVDAIYSQVAVLEDNASAEEDKAIALKMIIHLLGDIHQPLHTGHASDRGGNNHSVKFFNYDSNLHSVWDTSILEAGHAWSHSEWQREIDRLSDESIRAVLDKGTPDKWGEESYLICKQIYDETPQDTNISYDYVATWTPIIEIQLEKGGLRLADVLNSIFDPSYIPLNNFTKRR